MPGSESSRCFAGSPHFNVRTYNGEFGSSLPLKGPDRSEIKRGKRISYTLGTGSAEVDMESFGGGIRVRRAGAARTSRDF